MDVSTYGRMVDHGGYATGGTIHYSLVGEAGPEVVWLNAGDYVGVSPGTIHTATPPLVSNLDTRSTLTALHCGARDTELAATLLRSGFTATSVAAAVATSDLRLLRHSGVIHVQLDQPGARDEGDGTAGVPAKV